MEQRVIKFRAWFDGKMFDADHIAIWGGCFYLNREGNLNSKVKKIPGFTVTNVMQYTGLNDKGGVEIYEGDIVESEKWVSVGKYVRCIGVVKYVTTKFTIDCIGEWEGSNADLNGNATVIGNIFENANLLTSKTD